MTRCTIWTQLRPIRSDKQQHIDCFGFDVVHIVIVIVIESTEGEAEEGEANATANAFHSNRHIDRLVLDLDTLSTKLTKFGVQKSVCSSVARIRSFHVNNNIYQLGILERIHPDPVPGPGQVSTRHGTSCHRHRHRRRRIGVACACFAFALALPLALSVCQVTTVRRGNSDGLIKTASFMLTNHCHGTGTGSELNKIL